LLLLDEPTTGVDPLSRREFWQILTELRRDGVTILVSTPYMDEAAECNRVAFVHKGRVLTVSKPEEIPRLYQGTLLEISCPNLVAAGNRLRQDGRFASVQIFGDRIHLAAAAAAEVMSQWVTEVLADEKETIRIQEIPASIEDVFIAMLK